MHVNILKDTHIYKSVEIVDIHGRVKGSAVVNEYLEAASCRSHFPKGVEELVISSFRVLLGQQHRSTRNYVLNHECDLNKYDAYFLLLLKADFCDNRTPFVHVKYIM